MKLRNISNGALALGLALSGCAGMPSTPVGKNEFAPPTDLAGAIRAAQLQRTNGDLDGAIRTLSQLMLIAPDDPRVVGEYGKVLVAKGQTADALAFLGRAIELQPGDWMLFSAEGVAFSQAGDYQAAQSAFARALELKPDEPTVLNNEALAYLQTGDMDGAEKLLLQAKPDAPGYARIQQNLAMVQRMKESRRPARVAPSAPPFTVAAAPPAKQPVQAAPADRTPAPTAAAQSLAAEIAAPVETPVAAPVVSPAPPAAPEATRVLSVATPHTVPVATSAPRPLPAMRDVTPVPAAKASVTSLAKASVAPKATVSVAPKAMASAAPSAKARFVQISAFFVEAQATRAAAKFDNLGAHVFRGVVEGRPVFRLRLGPFSTLSDAKSALATAQMAGQADAMLVMDSVEAQAPAGPAQPAAPSLRMSQNDGRTQE